ncbi:uncharacterized protein LOC112905562 [Agrilus planipennis]|uniref:Uncharacterized protein LOC108738582 n=1 Tax=Agrilus planipennis TaxID=224129 RepID=A0A1W4WUI4_AGRPL|nr:uncharacterized protein LOC108738582 [Agrilus planipennis]XP_025833986.1 uncharacterized protein LOC112905562 [Agrilus planipennis]
MEENRRPIVTYDTDYIYLYVLVPFTVIAVVVVIYYVVKESARLSKRGNRTRRVVHSNNSRTQAPYSVTDPGRHFNTPPPPYQLHDTIRSPDGLPPPPPYTPR